MTFQGTFVDGVVRLNDPQIALPEDLKVQVEVDALAGRTDLQDSTISQYERYRSVIGTIKDAPQDLAAKHDLYLYGAEQE